jgi:predicted MFS family arabinose efflux permease
VVAALLCVAASGALIFALARDFTMLAAGRALLGLGVSAGLMGAIKAFTLWFPLSRLATLNGLYLATGGIGGLSATAPAEALIGPFGWRALFLGLFVLSLIASSLVFFVVPEKPLPGHGQTLRAQIGGFKRIFASGAFWRIALPLVVCHGAYLALQGLWLGPWLYDVAGEPRSAVGHYLLITALAYTVGSVFFGVSSDRLARAGVSRLTMFKLGLGISLAMYCLIAAGVHSALALILAVYGFTSISAALAYPLLTVLFPPEMTGRVNTASNVLMFGVAFVFQWAIGALLPYGYATALLSLAALQVAALAWLLPLRQRG